MLSCIPSETVSSSVERFATLIEEPRAENTGFGDLRAAFNLVDNARFPAVYMWTYSASKR